MLTLGIDLASQPANTGVCAVDWDAGAAHVVLLAVAAHDGAPLDDAWLTAAATGSGPVPAPGKVAIDAPFGWPARFVDAVGGASPADWPLAPGAARAERALLERRVTDLHVHAGPARKLPLSVSTDRIAYPAMRCAALLGSWARAGHQIDRAGHGLACEAYPDPAFRLLLPGLPQPFVSYKGTRAAARGRRQAILAELEACCAGRLRISAEHRAACIARDDALDALACAVIARAAALGLTEQPAPGQGGAAQREGWIHLPRAGVTLADVLAG